MDIVNLMEVFIESDLESIAMINKDSGILREVMENYEDEYRRQWIDHFIRVNKIMVENIFEEIKNEQREIGRIKELRRTGQSGEQPRTAIADGCKEGDVYISQKPNSNS